MSRFHAVEIVGGGTWNRVRQVGSRQTILLTVCEAYALVISCRTCVFGFDMKSMNLR